jgi:uncharacterized protein (DUF4213/DUF364 family)
MPFDPIRHFYKKAGYQQQLVEELVIGEKYTAVILKDGRIGVCATLGNPMEKIVHDFSVDLKKPTCRILLNAYFNAFLNYNTEFSGSLDIFDAVDFSKYHNIVMVGWFRSLHKKFRDAKIRVKAFDLTEENSHLSSLEDLPDALSEADAVVVSSTTIFNNTLKVICDTANPECDIYMLGPSTILHEDMFKYTRVKALFGSIFKPHDKMVVNIIRSGCGTPEFSGHMEKVFMVRPE